MRPCRALLVLALCSSAFGQTYTISSFAGGGLPQGASAALGDVGGVAMDAEGNAFITLPSSELVMKLNHATGVLTPIAGNGTRGFSGDNGIATSAQLSSPFGIAVDPAGNVYIGDVGNGRIRMVANGIITTVAGNGGNWCDTGDGGPATSATFCMAGGGLAVDSAGNIYVVDSGAVREISKGIVRTIAGSISFGYFGDNGPATSAQLGGFPLGLAVDSGGNIYISDSGNHCIRKISNGIITTIAGDGTAGFSGDNGLALFARLESPTGLAVDSSGNLYIADQTLNSVRKISNGFITTVAGKGAAGFSGDNGPATGASFNRPFGIALDSAGSLYVADYGNGRVRKISNGVITTVAGGGTGGVGDNGPPASAQLSWPQSVAVDAAGDVYIADWGNNRVRRVSHGVIGTVAGTGAASFGGDNGPAAYAMLSSPTGVAVDAAGNLYIADTGNARIREVSNGVITTVAGGGSTTADGVPATSAMLFAPYGIAVDSAGALYITDSFSNRVRKVSGGIIRTIAGMGTPGFSGDNGPAANAELNEPAGVAVDSAGNVYIADEANMRIRMVSNGVITTVAGSGLSVTPNQGGPATAVGLWMPLGVAVDSADNLYIADYENNVIRKVSGGAITTIAGATASSLQNPGGQPTAPCGFSGDNGPGASALLCAPAGVAVDATGNIYVADSQNKRVRLLTPSGTACSYSVSPVNLSAGASAGNISVVVQTGASCPWAVEDLPSWMALLGSSFNGGSATVNLSLAGNMALARSATIFVAGVSVMVNQAGIPAPVILTTSPLLSGYVGGPYSQDLAASGGAPPYTWYAPPGDLPPGLAINGPAITGTPTTAGTYNFTLIVTDSASTRTTLPCTITIVAPSGALTRAGSLSQVAVGGGWDTAVSLTNLSASPQPVWIIFHNDDGTPMTVSMTVTQQGDTQTVTASALNRVLNPNTTLLLDAGIGVAANSQGWAEALSTAPLTGFGVFRYAPGGLTPGTPGFVTPWEGTVLLQDQLTTTAVYLPFDNTSGFQTGVAIGNLGPAAGVTASLFDVSGNPLGTPQVIALAGSGHTAFMLNAPDPYSPTVDFSFAANKAGVLKLTGAPLSVVGLRASPYGTLTSIPVVIQ